jgi:hypothetical protein
VGQDIVIPRGKPVDDIARQMLASALQERSFFRASLYVWSPEVWRLSAIVQGGRANHNTLN